MFSLVLFFFFNLLLGNGAVLFAELVARELSLQPHLVVSGIVGVLCLLSLFLRNILRFPLRNFFWATLLTVAMFCLTMGAMATEPQWFTAWQYASVFLDPIYAAMALPVVLLNTFFLRRI